MACRRNIVFQALTALYTSRLQAAYSAMSDASRSLSDNPMAQAPEATPTIRIIEGLSRLIQTGANVFGMQEVDAKLECRVAATVDNPGLPQDRVNELEDVVNELFDPPIVVAGAGAIGLRPNGDAESFAGISESSLTVPIRVRFDREPGPLDVING